ncbi:Membrane-fusion protein [hydrothermal vent metagenome]|uniref:Membrane-fusion protein n=1 Tax=hydrothermal vent metagenome TaxID=652676 RepID=A0A1W1CQ97_9ZZZZ
MLHKILPLVFISLPLFASGLTVSIMHPLKKSLPLTIEANGVVVANNKSVITAKSAGMVHFYTIQNTFVSQGDLIAKVSNSLRQRRVQFLKNKIALQKSQLATEKRKLKNTQEKYTMGVGSKNSYLSEKIAFSQRKEIQENTQNEYNILVQKEQDAVIYAPQDGVITDMSANNSFIHYGEKIASLLSTNNSVKLFIDASYAQKIKKGMLVKLQSSYKNCNATIMNVLPKSSNNLIEVMAKPTVKLPLNLQLNAQIELKTLTGVLIPKEAIVLVDNHPAIYLIDAKNIAHLCFIEIQKDMINNALISNSLPKNANIALKNAYMLHDNLKVSVQ